LSFTCFWRCEDEFDVRVMSTCAVWDHRASNEVRAESTTYATVAMDACTAVSSIVYINHEVKLWCMHLKVAMQPGKLVRTTSHRSYWREHDFCVASMTFCGGFNAEDPSLLESKPRHPVQNHVKAGRSHNPTSLPTPTHNL
jgi:hypothetical protein